MKFRVGQHIRYVGRLPHAFGSFNLQIADFDKHVIAELPAAPVSEMTQKMRPGSVWGRVWSSPKGRTLPGAARKWTDILDPAEWVIAHG